jgi:sugar phosphate isomerase/epimerase
LSVPCLSSTFFKCVPDINPPGGSDDDKFSSGPSGAGFLEAETEKLQRLCAAADILGCEYIRGFTFFTEGTENNVSKSSSDNDASLLAPDLFLKSIASLIPFYSVPAQILRRYGKIMLLEADPGVHTTNHAQLAAFLDKLAHPAFAALYDPGTEIYDPCGEIPFPDGYRAVRKWLRHIHIKDAVKGPDGPKCVKPGTGQVDYPGLLQALNEDGYRGWLSLETHYRAGKVLSEEQMRIPQGGAFSGGGTEAMIESLAALREMMGRYDL